MDGGATNCQNFPRNNILIFIYCNILSSIDNFNFKGGGTEVGSNSVLSTSSREGPGAVLEK